MTLTIDLDPETEQIIEEKAASLGMTSSDYIISLAVGSFKPPEVKSNLFDNDSTEKIETPMTGAEVLEYFKTLNYPPGYGDPNIDSPELARQLRIQASRPNREPK